MRVRTWRNRRRSLGLLGGALFLAGATAVFMVMAALAVLGLLVVALVGAVMCAERLVGLLVPSYRRRHRERYLTMPRGLLRMVRFGSGPAGVIEARSYERHHET